jgi:hypothetical protein
LVSAGLALSAYDTYHDYGPHAHASYGLLPYIQVHLALSNKTSWDTRDVNFSYRHSYKSVIVVFEGKPELPWVETLKWWNVPV